MTEWVVVRYKFDEATRCWVYAGTMIFGSDELLLEYLRSQAHAAQDYRHEITVLLRPEG